MSFSEVERIFKNEFGDKADCFSIVHFKIGEAFEAVLPIANRPGVYLFGSSPIIVGFPKILGKDPGRHSESKWLS